MRIASCRSSFWMRWYSGPNADPGGAGCARIDRAADIRNTIRFPPHADHAPGWAGNPMYPGNGDG
ncbi:hypothetical protein ABGB12_03400 [Actinocorallia sp. B10E7]|uniref:hypothetical protein n=1 Tax=Actinocorallia sp. B10E7 TaxID=3153558 RepID=UPI00325F7294